MMYTLFRTRAAVSLKIVALLTLSAFVVSLLTPLAYIRAQSAPEGSEPPVEEQAIVETELEIEAAVDAAAEAAVDDSAPAEETGETVELVVEELETATETVADDVETVVDDGIDDTEEIVEETETDVKETVEQVDEEVVEQINEITEEVSELQVESSLFVAQLQEVVTGSIIVCKAVLDAEGNLMTGTDGSEFSVDILAGDDSVAGTATFDAPLTFSSDLLLDFAGDDAQCEPVDGLPLSLDGGTTFTYEAEVIDSDDEWLAPRYAELYLDQKITIDNDLLGVYAEANADIELAVPTVDLPNLDTRVLLVINQLEPDEPPLANACMEPSALGDESEDDIHDSGEPTVQEILDANGYADVHAMDDQRQYQVWNVAGGQEVTVGTTFFDREARHGNVFGYYTNSDTSTFVPLFRNGPSDEYADVPNAGSGDSYSFTVPENATTVGFAIKSYDGELTAIIATENGLNDGGDDNVAAYNPSENTYILAFEDLDEGSDYDFNDMVVEIEIDCADEDNGDGGDGGDNGGTGGGSLECIDGEDNDGDGLIDEEDPGCHTDGNADNPESYDPSDDDETNDNATTVVSTTRRDRDDDDDDDDEVFDGTGGPEGQVLGAAACGLYLTDYIRYGNLNDQANVLRLKQFLNDRYDLDLMLHGFYDFPTYEAVVRFQEDERQDVLTPWVGITMSSDDDGTGWVYKTTRRKINMIMCPELNIPMPPLTIDPWDL